MRAKFISTDRIDDAIRRIYLEHPDAKCRPGVQVLANRLGWPKWAIRRRARLLGLARIKEKPWSEDEIRVIERFAWMSDERLVVKLKTAGFGFVLLIAEFGEKGSCFYTANCNRNDVCNMMREFIQKSEPN